MRRMKTPALLDAELHARERSLRARRIVMSIRVKHFGRRLHERLGSVGLLGAGFAAGVLFDRLRPSGDKLRVGGALAAATLKLSPVMGMVSQQVRQWMGRSD